MIRDHFGKDRYWGQVIIRISIARIVHQAHRINPHALIEKAKGIRVREWLANLNRC